VHVVRNFEQAKASLLLFASVLFLLSNIRTCFGAGYQKPNGGLHNTQTNQENRNRRNGISEIHGKPDWRAAETDAAAEGSWNF
jgi:hypothetical protein